MSDIVIRNLAKNYGPLAVFKDFSATIKDRHVTVLRGISGAGKTTLARLLLGLEQPDGGEILGLEQRRFAAVFQEDRLIEHLGAVMNVSLVLPKGASRKEIEQNLGAVGICGEALQKPVRAFSGGMRRRVALVRAVMAPADTLLLDEPFKGLDDGSRNVALQYLRENTTEKTVILISHDELNGRELGAVTVPIP